MTNQPPVHPLPPGPWPVQRNHGLATASLVLGIVGLVVVPGLGVVAWIMGNIALDEIDAAPPGVWANRDHASAGKILGIVSLALYGLIFALVVLVVVVAVVASGV